MLKLRNVCKYYKVGKEKRIILDNITLDFGKKELVFILGSSGSGKSTLLNIIGGNLKSDSGEILLDNQYINKFNDRELNNYRSSMVGNVFQDYNLIDYMNVWDNIMLGYSNNDFKYVNLLLKQLGIYDKKKIIVNKLSGGEKQRVAIARALINNPDIILADEPTGALDTKNSIEVMEILKKISKNKLVIVVSHDINLANNYADRIINIKDGNCEYFPLNDNEIHNQIRKKKINNLSIIKLAFKNLWLKKMRTILTSFAVALGIVTMFLVINLYDNFNKEITLLEKKVVSLFPVIISNGEFEVDNVNTRSSNDKILVKKTDELVHVNKITQNYLNYIDKIEKIKYKTFEYDISMPVLTDKYEYIDNNYMRMIPDFNFIDDNYEIVYGKNIENKNQMLLKIDSNNNVDEKILGYFGINNDISYEEIIGRKIKVILNDEYYIDNNGYYIINNDKIVMYDNSKIELEIVGIIKEKEVTEDNSFIYYDGRILEDVMNINKNSLIVKSQLDSDTNVLGNSMDREEMLSYLGYNTLPSVISIYVDSVEDKEILINKLDDYNIENDKIIYVDTMDDAINVVKEFIMIISVILILFSLISIIISSLMILILTNTRVLERKREIGIFRSIGASRKDIKKMFNIENVIIGLISSIISLIIINLLVNPINSLMSYIGLDGLFYIRYDLMIIVFLINIFIIKIVGSIPANRASKLDIVSCIYNK